MSAFFFIEVAVRMYLYCKLKADKCAFCQSFFNMLDLGIVLVDVAAIAIELFLAGGGNRAAVQAVRMARLLRGARWARVVKIARSSRLVRNIVNNSCAWCQKICPPDEEELAQQREEAMMREVEMGVLRSEADKKLDPTSHVVKFTGYRSVRYADGCVFQGDWVEGFENGKGTMVFPTNDKYIGGFKNGLKHGRGRFQFSNGDKFVGSFLNNEKDGRGVYSWIDGDRYEATYLHGKEHGTAVFHSTDGRRSTYYYDHGVEVPPPKVMDEHSTTPATQQQARSSIGFSTMFSGAP